MSDARTIFLATLRAGLRGAPPLLIEETIADYTAHFDEGAAARRTDADIAAALGDPLTLADELQVESRIERWETMPSPRSALQVVAGALSRGAVNLALVFIAGPVLIVVAAGAVIAFAALLVSSIWFLFAGGSLGLPIGWLARILCSAGLFTAAISVSALTVLAAVTLVNGLGRYARLHYRILPRSAHRGSKP